MYKGNDEARKNGMAHYHDLRESYAKHMEYHGCGFGLFQPISAQDMTPPCCGYFDRNGDWNLICNLSTSRQAQKPLHWPGDRPAEPFAPLKYDPIMSTQINIEWQPKTSQDVESVVLNGGGQTPDNLPAGADVQIKYSSKSKFGAVLMTLRPITLHAYNDERLFLDWLNNNRCQLFETYGPELKKYGLWVVTRTYNAPGCSINAWMDNSKDSVVSLKAKASMLGELADGEVKWSDKAADKDWSHYKAGQDDALVVFMDGIQVARSEWYLEGMRQVLGKRSPSRGRSSSSSPRPQVQDDVIPAQVGEPLEEQKRRVSGAFLSPPRAMSYSMSRSGSVDATSPANGTGTAKADVGVMPTWSENTQGPTTHGGTQARQKVMKPRPKSYAGAGYLVTTPIQMKQARHDSGLAGFFTKMDAPLPWSPHDPDFNTPIDGETLKDAGFDTLSRRSISIRRPSDGSDKAPSIALSTKTAATDMSRTKSLRRETRSVSGQSTHSRRQSAA